MLEYDEKALSVSSHLILRWPAPLPSLTLSPYPPAITCASCFSVRIGEGEKTGTAYWEE